MRRPRLMYVVTHPVTADLLLRGQLAFMREHGFDVTVVASPGAELTDIARREGVRTVAVPMTRAVSPARDLGAVARMASVMRQIEPDIVNASTPKGGLVGMLTARALGVPVRIYLLRGLRLETTRGALRRVLGVTERVASSCAHDVPCVSRSLLDAAVSGGHVAPEKALVLGAGSSNGVDPARFERTPARVEEGRRLLGTLGVAPGAKTIAFVGRFVEDKGVHELLEAFRRVRAGRTDARLLLVGAELGGETARAALLERARTTPGVVLTGTMRDLAPVYAAADVLAFPSHREGFPNVVVEAATAELPAVGFRVTGTTDGIVHGETGMLVPRRDVSALAEALGRYLDDDALRLSHGAAARKRAVDEFSCRRVWERWLELYQRRLASASRPLARPDA